LRGRPYPPLMHCFFIIFYHFKLHVTYMQMKTAIMPALC
jgi:hypothetical protein